MSGPRSAVCGGVHGAGANVLSGTVHRAGPDAVLDVPGVGAGAGGGGRRRMADGRGGAPGAAGPSGCGWMGWGVNRAEGVVTELAYRGDVLDAGGAAGGRGRW